MVGLILGIVSLILAYVPIPLAANLVDATWLYWIAPFIAVAGVILSAMGMKKAKLDNQATGVYIAGLVVSIIATVNALPWLCLRVICASYGL